MTRKLLIATKNLHKVAELKALFKQANLDIDLYSFHQFPDYVEPEETGQTFEENAILKATKAAQTLGIEAVADDSGLVVPALQGAPGVISARYAGEKATDKENREKLLLKMRSLKGIDRYAYFECCLALASPEKLQFTVKGTCEGAILEKERGRNGFGYDPLFLKHEWSKTFAEIDDLTKNRVSHRKKAFEKFILELEQA